MNSGKISQTVTNCNIFTINNQYLFLKYLRKKRKKFDKFPILVYHNTKIVLVLQFWRCNQYATNSHNIQQKLLQNCSRASSPETKALRCDIAPPCPFAQKKGASKDAPFEILVYIKLLIVEIRISPATTRSSAAKPSAKLSEYSIWAFGGNSSSPAQTRICIW